MSQQNQSTLQAAINTQLADNTTGDISAADVRDNLINMTDSLLFNSGSQGITGSFTATSFTGSLQGTATTASYINPTFISESAAASGFGSGGGSSISTGSFATTGSNIFRGNQVITGSFTQTSGSIALGLPDIFGNRNFNYFPIGSNEYVSLQAGALSGSPKTNLIHLNGSTNEISILSNSGTIYLRGATNITLSGSVFLQGLPTSEPANVGQLWLSGSVGVSSKVLCMRV
jgi:hypothetical protein